MDIQTDGLSVRRTLTKEVKI